MTQGTAAPSIIVSSKSDNLHAWGSRQYEDQAALTLQIAQLGERDALPEAQQDLAYHLSSTLLAKPLFKKVDELVRRIVPFGRLSASKENLKQHIVEMHSSWQSILHEDEILKKKDFYVAIVKLQGIYQRALEKLNVEGIFDSSIASPVVGQIYISQNVANAIVALKDGKPVKSLDAGSRPVNFHANIYWKITPSAPLYERAFHLLGKLACNIASAPAEFVVVRRKVGSETQLFPTQASLAVNGISMSKVLRELPDYIPKLDKRLFGFTVILHILGNPQDAHGANYIAIPEENKEGEVINVTWKGIDEDLCFSHPIIQFNQFNFRGKILHAINVRSFFFCLPQMYTALHPDVIAHFTHLLPASVVMHYLQELWEMDQKLIRFAYEEGLDQENMHEMHIPFLLLPHIPETIFAKLCRLQTFLKGITSTSNYMDLFKKVFPEIAYTYDVANTSKLNPLDAFDEVWRPNLPYEEIMRSYMQLPLISSRPLAEDLVNIKHTSYDYEEKRNTPPGKAAEQFLESLDLSMLSSADEQQVLAILQSFPLENITLCNSSFLDDEKMVALIKSQKHLSKLRLVGCSNITRASLATIYYHNPSLHLILSNCAHISSEDVKSFSFRMTTVTEERATQLAPPLITSLSQKTVQQAQFDNLAAAFLAENWQQATNEIESLRQQNSLEETKIKITNLLITGDLMVRMVKNGDVASLKLLQSLNIALEITNSQSENFWLLCLREDKRSMLAFLCSFKVDWKNLIYKRRTALHVAIEQHAIEEAKLLIASGALSVENPRNSSLPHMICQEGLEEILSLLLAHDAKFAEKVDARGRTPLYTAIEYNQLGCGKILMAKMEQVDVVDEKKTTPLMHAAKFNRLLFLQALLNRKASTLLANSAGETAVEIAALAGASDVLKVLLGNRPTLSILSLNRSDKKTLLHLVSLSGNLQSVTYLTSLLPPLEGKEFVTARDSRGMAAAHCAAAAGFKDIVAVFIDQGISPDLPVNISKETLLMLALNCHHFATVDMLLTKKANLACTDNKGLTAVLRAAKEGDCLALDHLLKKDQSLTEAGNSRRVRPLHLAAASGHLPAIRLLCTTFKADIHAKDIDGKTAFLWAVQNGHEEAAKLLVSFGADLTAAMGDGWTALHYAVNYTFPSLVEYILSLHPELLEARTEVDGHAPLHKAMYQEFLSSSLSPQEMQQKVTRQLNVLQILLQYGADVDIVDNYNYVPLHLAVKYGRAEFVTALLNRGASPFKKNKYEKTPYEHGIYYADGNTNDPEKKANILKATELLKKPEAKFSLGAISSLFSASSSGSSPTERRNKFLGNLKADKGFRKETLLLARDIETLSDNSSSLFTQSLDTICQEWNCPSLYSKVINSLNCDALNSLQKILDKCLLDPSATSGLTLIPIVGNPADFIQLIATKLSSAPNDTVNIIAALNNQEIWMATDFPKTTCQSIIKYLPKAKKEEKLTLAKKIMEDPKQIFPLSQPFDFKLTAVHEKRKKMELALDNIFDETRAQQHEEFIDQLTFSFMQWSRERFSQLMLRDIRHLMNPSLARVTSVWDTLLETGNALKGNCLLFLLSSGESARRKQCLKFVIDWINRALRYGDFHQAFSLFQALRHPTVVRLRQMRKKLPKNYSDQVQQYDTIFSPAANYSSYTTLLDSMLSPSIPAFSIFASQAKAFTTLTEKFLALQSLRNMRLQSNRLILPPYSSHSEFLLLLTKDYYPHSEDGEAFPGERYAYKRTLEIEPPLL